MRNLVVFAGRAVTERRCITKADRRTKSNRGANDRPLFGYEEPNLDSGLASRPMDEDTAFVLTTPSTGLLAACHGQVKVSSKIPSAVPAYSRLGLDGAIANVCTPPIVKPSLRAIQC